MDPIFVWPNDKCFVDDCGLEFHWTNLTIEDDDGGLAFILIKVTVHNVAPTAIAGDDVEVLLGEAVTFGGSFTDPSGLDTHTFAWDFGDENTANDTLTPSHTYTSGGEYTVTLTVTDDDEGVGTDTLVVRVIEATVDIKVDIDEPVVGDKIKVTADISNAAGFAYTVNVLFKVDGEIVLNQTSHNVPGNDTDAQNPSYEWEPEEAGDYDVEVIVEMDGKVLASSTEKVTVEEATPWTIYIVIVIVIIVVLLVAVFAMRKKGTAKIEE